LNGIEGAFGDVTLNVDHLVAVVIREKTGCRQNDAREIAVQRVPRCQFSEGFFHVIDNHNFGWRLSGFQPQVLLDCPINIREPVAVDWGRRVIADTA
jgi:hypothetical protein